MGAVISADRPGPNSLHQALRERALEWVELVMKVALLVGAGFSRGEIGPPLDVSPGQVWRAVTDLQAIAERVDLGDRPGTDESWGPLSFTQTDAGVMKRRPRRSLSLQTEAKLWGRPGLGSMT